MAAGIAQYDMDYLKTMLFLLSTNTLTILFIVKHIIHVCYFTIMFCVVRFLLDIIK